MLKTIYGYLGIEPDTASQREKIISGLGGFVGIFAVIHLSSALTAMPDMPLIVASMGASAVLLFAAPHGRFSQPWNLIAGHLVSALIGVSCALWVDDVPLAAALAVGLSITAMYYLRCIHPPGGATALFAVIGSPEIQALGYQYVLTPIGLNVLIILVVALAVNFLTVWRRYPAHLHRRLRPVSVAPRLPSLQDSDIDYALRHIGSYVDVSYEELETIYRLAEQHAQADHVPVEALRLGHYYSNGRYGAEWGVRQIVDEGQGEGEGILVIYKVVAGNGRRSTGSCSRAMFARWAKHEVYLNENSWLRVP